MSKTSLLNLRFTKDDTKTDSSDHHNFSAHESWNKSLRAEGEQFYIELKCETNHIINAIIQCNRKYFLRVVNKYPEEINSPGTWGALPLHFAAAEKSGFYTKGLIDRGSNINISDKKNYTPLLVAVIYQNIKSVKLLMEAGADPYIQNENKQDAFDIASWLQNVKISNILHSSMGHYDYQEEVPVVGELYSL